MLKNIVRALRLPFIAASVLPFIFGSLLAGRNFHLLSFLLGLLAVAATHLSANLMNDYADSKSGVDWRDMSFYGFFGGSKLIQEGAFSEKFYRNLAIFFAVVSLKAVIVLSVLMKSFSIIGFYALILFLGWSYSTKPLQLAYRGVGEVIIFTLFGPALVMGGYFIQTKIFPTLQGFLLSLPFGFLTCAILFANEIPDFPQDKRSGKINWVSLLGERRSFLIYYLLVFLGFGAILFAVYRGYLGRMAILSFFFISPAIKAGQILRRHYADKEKLIASSKMTIIIQTWVSIFLILDLIL